MLPLFEWKVVNVVLHLFLCHSLDLAELNITSLYHLYRLLKSLDLLVFGMLCVDEFLTQLGKFLLKLAKRFLGLIVDRVDASKLALQLTHLSLFL
jgi:hypothetical protein